ncbi:hypothetical protein D3218_03265 [Aureimonas flava]|uniref:Uncharacterized protein n=1 Tax=Aureimonas flava TaxID=2320271 RepID=A0A3A1WYF4_9HYPH|nr:AAA family ATPase [Aureimonas flava]RIY03769.1 hypothetical protein D3218_03265 [Aureimonas flava]
MTQAVIIESVLTPDGRIFNGRDEDGQRRRFVCRTIFRPPVVGETWQVAGVVRRHPTHGQQVEVSSAHLVVSAGRAIVELLQGPRFPGVGPAAASRLWSAFGARLPELLSEGEEGAIAEALGGTDNAWRQAATLTGTWPDVRGEAHVATWLDRAGIGPAVATKVASCYGSDATALLEEDPYRLLAFMPWSAVDGLATRMGVAPDDRRRLVAACEAVLYEALDSSDTWLPDAGFRRALGLKLSGRALVAKALACAVEMSVVERIDGGWQALGPATMERFVAGRVAELVRRGGRSGLELPPTDRHGLSEEQKAAVRMAVTWRFSLLLGGAGVGKTTALRALCDVASGQGFDLHLMALSGRAAKRVAESTGRSASTIARWLQAVSAGTTGFGQRPLVVVDEASMVDLSSLYRIMRATPDDGGYVLIGDPGQLPPVSFGLTLHALVPCASVPRVELSTVFRQAAATGIPTLAAAIRVGDVPEIPAFAGTELTGAHFVECPVTGIVGTVANLLDRLDDGSVQVIGSVKGRGDSNDGGIRAVNAVMRAKRSGGKPELTGGFFEGEPVVWTRNDRDRGLTNGTLGHVAGERDGDGGRRLRVTFDGVEHELAGDSLRNLELAWAITAHKSQGSAFGTVIVLVSPNRLLDRALLYTAVTRARERVILIGSVGAFAKAVGSPPSASRRSVALGAHLAALGLAESDNDAASATGQVPAGS